MSQRTMRVWFFISFLLLGISATLLGPTLESLTVRYDMALDNGGLFITLHSTGVTISLLVMGWLYGRYPPRWLLVIGPALTAAGLLVLATTSVQMVAFAATFVFGLGFGGVLIGPNNVVAALNPGQSAGHLNALNMFFGLGAIAGPQVVNAALSLDDFTLAYVFTAVFALILIPPFLRVDLPTDLVAGSRSRGAVPVNAWVFVPFAALLFAYVGSEIGFGAWIATQMTEVVRSSDGTATVAVSLFWAGLTAGRAAAIVVSRYLRPLVLLFLAVSVILAGVVVVLVTGIESVALVSAFVVGFGCGPVFPTTLAAISDHYPAQFAAVSGTVIAVGNMGAMVIPWLQGQIGGGESGGMVVTLALTVVMLAILVGIERQVRATTV